MSSNMDLRLIPSPLLRFEVQVAEHCNLNCINCMHYSPIASPEFLDVEKYEADIKRLSELFCKEVEWIRLMGGEPLLHPDINRIIRITREYFHYGHIILVTNGILLDKMSSEFWGVCRENNIEISPTKYPIKLDYDSLVDYIDSKGIKGYLYGIGEERNPEMWRFPIDIRGDFDPVENFYNCDCANLCLTLRDGMMYTCATMAHAHHLKDFFDLDISISDRNGISIYEVSDGDELMKKLAEPRPFCRYCDYRNYLEYADDWRVSEKCIYEWVSFVFSNRDIEWLKNSGDIYIFGAGKWGHFVLNELKKNKIEIKNILVTSKVNNPDSISNVPILDVDSLGKIGKNDVCFIALSGSEKKKIQSILRSKGFNRIIPIMKID